MKPAGRRPFENTAKVADMDSEIQKNARNIRRLKNRQTDEERLQGWQQTCADKGLSGEFALAAKIGGEAYTDEQVRMVAELFGR